MYFIVRGWVGIKNAMSVKAKEEMTHNSYIKMKEISAVFHFFLKRKQPHVTRSDDSPHCVCVSIYSYHLWLAK